MYFAHSIQFGWYDEIKLHIWIKTSCMVISTLDSKTSRFKTLFPISNKQTNIQYTIIHQKNKENNTRQQWYWGDDKRPKRPGMAIPYYINLGYTFSIHIQWAQNKLKAYITNMPQN